ncbi:hypothetical protein BIW11_08899, partial [Tropilaelaps mercedesae]
MVTRPRISLRYCNSLQHHVVSPPDPGRMFPKSQYLQVPGGGGAGPGGGPTSVVHSPCEAPSAAPSRHSSLPAPTDGSSPLLALDSLALGLSHSLGNFADLQSAYLMANSISGATTGNGFRFPLELANCD